MYLLVANVLVAAPRLGWSETAAEKTNARVGRLHYEAGENLYRAGRVREALVEFKTGYALTARPLFLLNIAQCQRKLGDLEAARDNLLAYVGSSPNSPIAPEARTLLDEIETQLKEQARNKPPAPTPPVETPATAQPVSPPSDSTVAATPAAADNKSLVTAPQVKKKTPVYKKWWLWTTVSVVAVGVSLAIALPLTLKHSSPKCTDPNNPICMQ